MKLKLFITVGILAIILVGIVGCQSGGNTPASTTPAASPIMNTSLFRSDRYYISVQLPPGWAGIEGPESIATKTLEGDLAFNSWGQKDFWVHAFKLGGSETYSTGTVISQVPAGGVYVALIEIHGPPLVTEDKPPEYTLNDLSGLITSPYSIQNAPSSSRFIDFFKWGRSFELEIACQAGVSDATINALNDLLQSWRFDEIAAGDPGWAFTIAGQLLPQQVEPKKFSDHSSTDYDQTVARETEVDILQDKTVHFRFTYYWNLPATPSPGPIDTPSETYHWWEIDVLPSGKAILTAQGGTLLPISTPLPVTSIPSPTASGEPVQTRELSESEKQKVIEIALNSPQVQQWLNGRTDYQIRPIEWYAIHFQDGEANSWGIVNPGDILPPPFLTQPISYYPGVTIAVGEDTIYQMQIAVDLDAGKIVMIDGPYPALNSPSRLRDLNPKPTVTPATSP